MIRIFQSTFAVLALLLATSTLTSAQSTFDWVSSDIDVYNMEVIKVTGQKLTVRIDGMGRRTFQVPKDFKFYIEGRPVGVARLGPRQKLTAYIVRTPTGLALADAGPVRADPPATPPKTPIVAAAVAEPVAAMLPSTGSLLPLIGLSGFAALLVAGFSRRLRRAS